MDDHLMISVAMATYNGEKYLGEQLNSFLHQTRLPDELVIFDDHSTDKTIDILKTFRETAPFQVRLYKNRTNVGYARNFEKTIDKATGDFIFLSDQDDIWFNNKIETIVKVFEAHPEAWLVVNDQHFVDENFEPLEGSHLHRLQKLGFSQFQLRAGCCTAFRKELKAVVLPMKPDLMVYDSWIHDFAEMMNKKHVHPEVLQNHRRHQQNASNSLVKTRRKLRTKEILFRLFSTGDKKKYENKISVLYEIKKRLQAQNALPDRQRKLIDARILSLKARVDLIQSGFFVRKAKALKMFTKGHYNQFRGYKSFLKDFIK